MAAGEAHLGRVVPVVGPLEGSEAEVCAAVRALAEVSEGWVAAAEEKATVAVATALVVAVATVAVATVAAVVAAVAP